MPFLEIFVHDGCISEQPALALAQEIQREFPALHVQIWQEADGRDRAQALGILAVPAFVLDGQVLAVGVPGKEWLVRKLLDREPQGSG